MAGNGGASDLVKASGKVEAGLVLAKGARRALGASLGRFFAGEGKAKPSSA